MATQLTPEYVKQVNQGFNRVFTDAIKDAHKDYELIATQIKASTPTVRYDFLADLPSMREWIGDRVLNELSVHEYSIVKKDWEASIKVHRDNIVYDNLGIVKPKIQSLAEAVTEHYEGGVFGMLEANGVCYDGKAFFATDHEINGVTFSNLGNRELSREAVLETMTEMKRITKDNGTPLRVRPTLLIVPPELASKAIEIINAERVDGGNSNVTYKMFELYICDWLTDQKSWYLLDTSRVLKPIILQINKEAEFVSQDNLSDEAAFLRKEFRYGVDTEDNFGYGLWQLAYKNEVA